jgi:pyrroloquinoline quinone biosynthesis protein D
MHKEKLLVVNNHFQLQWEEQQNCFVLLYPEGMVQLSQSAGEIMNLCDGNKSCENIVQALEEKFQTSGLEKDIIEFLDDAIQRDWVIYQ